MADIQLSPTKKFWLNHATGTVISKSVHSRTTVHGGGISVINNTVYSPPVTSSTRISQEVWIRDSEGEDHQFHALVPIAEGQVVTLFWGNEAGQDKGPYRAIYNHSSKRMTPIDLSVSFKDEHNELKNREVEPAYSSAAEFFFGFLIFGLIACVICIPMTYVVSKVIHWSVAMVFNLAAAAFVLSKSLKCAREAKIQLVDEWWMRKTLLEEMQKIADAESGSLAKARQQKEAMAHVASGSYCPECGASVGKGYRFCGACGHELPKPALVAGE